MRCGFDAGTVVVEFQNGDANGYMGCASHAAERLLMIWDGAPIHRSRMVLDYIASTGGRIAVERLPAYAPELNPAEYIWTHLK